MTMLRTGRLLMLTLVAALAACASKPPAPVENRTRPAPVAPAAAHTAPAAAPDTPGVQTAPVRPSALEVRPVPRPAVPSALVRREPKVQRRPYSDALLAELRGDAGSVGAAAPARGAEPVATTSAPAAAPAGARTTGTAGAATGASGAPGAHAATTGGSAAGTSTGTTAGAPASGSAAPAAASPASAAAGSAAGAAAAGASAPGAEAGDFAWPAKGKVVRGFSEPRQMGVLISGNAGDPVSAAADGKVIFSGTGPRGYGNLLIVKHDADTLSVYAHNRALLVKEGQSVKRGQKIAELGDSGTDKPQLHFEIRKSGKPVDPQKLLPAR